MDRSPLDRYDDLSSMTHGPKTPAPAAPLREVPVLLRKQWKKLVETRAPILRWVLVEDEWPWVETFLEGRLDGRSKVFVVENAFEGAGYGFAVASTLLPSMTRARIARRAAFVPKAMPRGLSDADALASQLIAFERHVQGSAISTIGVVLAPSDVRDAAAWVTWVEGFAGALVRAGSGVRVVLLEDQARPAYELIARRYPHAVATERAGLEIAVRTARMVESSLDPSSLSGQIRALSVRTLTLVNEKRTREAEVTAQAVERLAHQAAAHAAVVPVRFAIAGGLLADGKALDAVTSYRAAEAAAERAEAAETPNASWLRVTTRFGVAAGMLAVPNGATHAARYYEETVPHCQKMGDTRLELECHRCAAVAYEMARLPKPAWEACVRALALVDRLDAEQRESAMLVPLADAMLRLTSLRDLGHLRPAAETELRKRRMHGSAWA